MNQLLGFTELVVLIYLKLSQVTPSRWVMVAADSAPGVKVSRSGNAIFPSGASLSARRSKASFSCSFNEGKTARLFSAFI